MKLQKKGLFWITTVVILVSIFATSGVALASTSRMNSSAAVYPMAIAPSLGAAQGFAVLGGSTVTNTGSTVVSGDLGLHPGTSITGFPPGILNGTQHQTDGPALNAQNAVTTAYNALAAQPCDTDLTGQDLGGLTLVPGVYCFSSSAQLTGTLTLNAQGDANAVWVFQIGSTLTTASSSSVVIINGGSPCNVFWQVGSSATLGTTTSFKGNILALQSITLNTGATMTGRVLARNGAVTLDTNTISASACTGSPPSPFGVLEIFKFNDLNGNGIYEPGLGDSPLSGWQFATTGPSFNSDNFTNGSGFIVLPGLTPGSYTATENVTSGWTVTTSNPQTVILAAGDVTILSFGNVLGSPTVGHIRAFKYDDTNKNRNYDSAGGELPLGGWQFCIAGICRITQTTGFTPYWDVVPGTYTVCETTRPVDWINSDPGGSSCKTITVTAGQSVIVYFGNYEIAPARLPLVTQQPPQTRKPSSSPALTGTPGPVPACIKFTVPNICPTHAIAGQPVTIATDMVNEGGEVITQAVPLMINGQTEQTRTIAIGPGATYPVKFTVTKAQPGTYNVSILGQQSSFTVSNTESNTTSQSANVGLIVILVFGVLVMIAVVAVLLARRPA